ncbi:MAG: hypothetical protein UT32_C0011G0038 [Parcubacteria group bacterium GW2011_GWC2_39_14]|nr:MAG: hypothetical protein UT32_C0011G0038 [Parcubacteria group bacterium GW2011_GWC2_39_14]KKR55074.1 MAG: hypothetical protein UT91_C0005G0075 [Parcubacteria group bacterium GW2011_GWA2_40_23]
MKHEVIVSIEPKQNGHETRTEKGDFGSIVTINYFNGWDEEMKLDGPAGITAKIRANMIRLEEKN